jgi:hypothetical protein
MALRSAHQCGRPQSKIIMNTPGEKSPPALSDSAYWAARTTYNATFFVNFKLGMSADA